MRNSTNSSQPNNTKTDKWKFASKVFVGLLTFIVAIVTINKIGDIAVEIAKDEPDLVFEVVEINNEKPLSLNDKRFEFYPVMVNKGNVFIDTYGKAIFVQARRDGKWSEPEEWASGIDMPFPFPGKNIAAFKFKSVKGNIKISVRQKEEKKLER